MRSERVAQKQAVLRRVEPDVLAALSALRVAGLRPGVVTNAEARRAIWFLSRWPRAAVADGEPGLRQVRDVVQAAGAA